MILRERHRRSVARCGKASVTSRTRSPHALPLSQGARRNSRFVPLSARSPCRALGPRGPRGKHGRSRLVERRHAAARERRARGALACPCRPPGELEGHFRRPQLDRVQARGRRHLDPLRRAQLGRPVHSNGWEPDGRWFGDVPRVLTDVRGAEAAALIPKVEATIAGYAYNNLGDYRAWPGPNSNTFIATLLRAVPELGITLPSNAVGKDFRAYLYRLHVLQNR